MNFAIVRKAGLTAGEFGVLAGVSRVTVSLWLNDRCKPHRLHEGRVQVLLKAVAAAVKAGSLPLDGVERDARARAIKRVVIASMRSLKESVA